VRFSPKSQSRLFRAGNKGNKFGEKYMRSFTVGKATWAKGPKELRGPKEVVPCGPTLCPCGTSPFEPRSHRHRVLVCEFSIYVKNHEPRSIELFVTQSTITIKNKGFRFRLISLYSGEEDFLAFIIIIDSMPLCLHIPSPCVSKP
jgi:hypothetical protein